MKTRWDCLFALLELRESTLAGIAKKAGTSPSSARQRMVALMRDGFATQSGTLYSPNRANSAAWTIYDIMKYCNSRGVNYNLFLSLEFAKIVRIGTSKDQVAFSEFEGLNPATVRKYLGYLARAQLLLITARRPFVVKFAHAPVFDDVLELFGMKKEKRKMGGRFESAAEYREIEYLLEKYRKMKKNFDLSKMEENRKMEFASSSVQIEGNSLTFDEVKELILHDNVPQNKKMKEASEVKNYYMAVEYLFSHLEEPMAAQFILELQKIAMFNLGAKEGLRSENTTVRMNPNFKAVSFPEVLPRLGRLCEDMNEFLSDKRTVGEAVEFATFAHNEIQHIRPFDDGNARVARLLWNYILLRSGFPLVVIYSTAREEYGALTKMAKERDDARLNEFLVKIIKDSLYRVTRVEA